MEGEFKEYWESLTDKEKQPFAKKAKDNVKKKNTLKQGRAKAILDDEKPTAKKQNESRKACWPHNCD
ncbi:hypothetical protein VKT23_005455 [Stygiomarasmius scandens]|uniref:Uncharacterized protein n=1 Tax=Marasmiellus scandens TaxID=2682957 RepID=A0ABR1JWJ0_9AGAR